MNGAAFAAHGKGDVRLKDGDFSKIAVFAKRHFGLSLSDNKIPLVESRLSRRLTELKIGSFSDYVDMLERSDQGEERSELLSLLTTNVTQFFREPHHFDTLRTEVLPPLIDEARRGGRIRLWSAGCSNGQEPYTMAMVVHALYPQAHKLDIKILGTDIDPVVVRRAMAANYRADDLAQIPAEYRNQGKGTPWVKLPKDVRSLVSFGTLNLIEPFPFSGKFDAIFCRNVAIYFDKQTQQKLWEALEQSLTPNGYLFIGHSERMSGPAKARLETAGITTYRKIA